MLDNAPEIETEEEVDQNLSPELSSESMDYKAIDRKLDEYHAPEEKGSRPAQEEESRMDSRVPLDAYMIDFVFSESEEGGIYDNRNSMDYQDLGHNVEVILPNVGFLGGNVICFNQVSFSCASPPYLTNPPPTRLLHSTPLIARRKKKKKLFPIQSNQLRSPASRVSFPSPSPSNPASYRSNLVVDSCCLVFCRTRSSSLSLVRIWFGSSNLWRDRCVSRFNLFFAVIWSVLVGRQERSAMAKSSFKLEHPLEKRQAEASRIREKYNDRIPVIVEKAERTDIPDIDKKKYLVPADLTVGQFVYVVRKRIKLSAEKAIFIFVKNTLPPTAALMSAIYEENKDEDGFLYMTYSEVFSPKFMPLYLVDRAVYFTPVAVTRAWMVVARRVGRWRRSACMQCQDEAALRLRAGNPDSARTLALQDHSR
ncbi:hypothetical protein GUJ93_ZPchr0004g38489 [Zizania palustris]|uniref:Autophagy-related protein n=1 Tax=Zizania palustris TaxID=103762 RepID=A0A8J5VZK5_ZIZPA|nr:hypothetical protein GUJ93_ZPchr0004g38489 [Zizania palustris]